MLWFYLRVAALQRVDVCIFCCRERNAMHRIFCSMNDIVFLNWYYVVVGQLYGEILFVTVGTGEQTVTVISIFR